VSNNFSQGYTEVLPACLGKTAAILTKIMKFAKFIAQGTNNAIDCFVKF